MLLIRRKNFLSLNMTLWYGIDKHILFYNLMFCRVLSPWTNFVNKHIQFSMHKKLLTWKMFTSLLTRITNNAHHNHEKLTHLLTSVVEYQLIFTPCKVERLFFKNSSLTHILSMYLSCMTCCPIWSHKLNGRFHTRTPDKRRNASVI